MPSTISSAVSVARLIQAFGSARRSIMLPVPVPAQDWSRNRSIARRSALVGRPRAGIPARRRRFPAEVAVRAGLPRQRRRQILVQRLRFGRRSAADAEFADFDDPDAAALRKGQHIASPHPVVRLGDRVSVHPQFSAIAQFAGQRPGLEEPGIPKPLVDARPDLFQPGAGGSCWRARHRSSGSP